MEGTREYLLNKILSWVDGSAPKNGSNTYWIYGLPRIGKTSLAHSISRRLHDRKQLAGAFFCRRDDPKLNESRNILPTLIHQLAIVFPPFRSIVAKHLRNDLNLTPESMKETFLLDLTRALPRHQTHTIVFVIDALDETGGTLSRPGLLRALTDAATHAPWLKILITSRPEIDIQRFFDNPAHSLHIRYDLAADPGASAARKSALIYEPSLDANSIWWPLFNKAISHANGLFIFIKTVVLTLAYCDDPTESISGGDLAIFSKHWLQLAICTLLQYPKIADSSRRWQVSTSDRSASCNSSVPLTVQGNNCRAGGSETKSSQRVG